MSADFSVLDAYPVSSPFLTPEFQETWWQILGRGELRLLELLDGKRRLGAAPLFIHDEQLSFIGCVDVADYLDFAYSRSTADQFFDQLGKILAPLPWKTAQLCSITESSPTRQQLSRLAKQYHWNFQETIQDVAPFIDLPDSWDIYLANLKRKQRHEIKRKMRRLESTAHTLRVMTGQNHQDIQQAIADFITLHHSSSTDKSRFWDENHLNFFKQLLPKMAAAGYLKLYFLDIEGTPAASMLVFSFGDTDYLYNSGFSPQDFSYFSPGIVLTAYTIKMAIEDKKHTYDFLRGDEEYKYRFGAVNNTVYDIQLSKG